MLKAAGVLLLSSSAAIGGLYLSAKIKKAQILRKELTALVREIGTGITHGALPLTDIYAHFSAPALERCGFCDMLRKAGLSEALDTVLPQLDKDTARIFVGFAGTIGKSAHKTDETAKCERTAAALDKIDASGSGAENTRAELYRRLGLLGAVCAALVAL